MKLNAQFISIIILLSFFTRIFAQIPVSKKDEGTSLSPTFFVPNATKAVIFSIIPGLGQIYNRKYWKLPIIYAGFLGCFYATTWNNRQYNFYKNAYLDLIHNNPSQWENYQEIDFANFLRKGRDSYRKYRDLSCIITGGLYILCMVDAYVDAQLFDFDISEDLSFKVKPVFLNTTTPHSLAFGYQCRIYFD